MLPLSNTTTVLNDHCRPLKHGGVKGVIDVNTGSAGLSGRNYRPHDAKRLKSTIFLLGPGFNQKEGLSILNGLAVFDQDRDYLAAVL